MGFLDGVMDSFSAAGQDVAKKAKNATESMKLNNQIKSNERMIEKLIHQVGVLCVQNHITEPGTEYDDLFQEITRLRNENARIEEEIRTISAEKICPNCGFGNELDVSFCVKCGTNLRNAETSVKAGKRCSNCGAMNGNEAMFCVECGTRFPNENGEE